MENTAARIVIEDGKSKMSIHGDELARGFLAKYNEQFSRTEAAPAVSLYGLPAIGAQWQGGIYAGVSIENEQPVALVLLPGDESMKWKDAVAWAKKQGSTLPTRIDHLVLFKNLKKEFKEEYYWSGEQYAADPDYAWVQYFTNGGQDGYRMGDYNRARAVRRVQI